MPQKIPNWAKNFVVQVGKLAVDGEQYEYTILSREMEPKLPGFVGYPNGEFLMISEEVPTRYHTYILKHEVREYVALRGVNGRCVTTLKQELLEVGAFERIEYIKYRIAFFERLVAYYQDSKDTEFVNEIRNSLLYLRRLNDHFLHESAFHTK
jgi:hypothetical protein